jgi:hypothetical protein
VTVSLCIAGLLALAGPAAAQDEELHPVTISVSGGFTTVTGSDAGKLDHGGAFQAGIGHFFTGNFGITGNFMFHGLGITRNQLNTLGQPDGSARVYSFTIDPVVKFQLAHGWSAYATGGGGYLRRTIEFTQPTVAQTFVVDPWWGYLGPALIPVNQILGSITSNAGALDIGAGVNIPLPNTQIRFFVESRYLHGFTKTSGTSVVPILFGNSMVG